MKPEKTYRIGLISGSVFTREVDTEGGKRQIRNVNLQRRYRDDSGEWKSATSFGLADLPVAITVLKMAMDHVASKEAETVG